MQLRPKVQNHELSSENQRRVLKYNLDISLFERLCTSGIRSTTEDNLKFPFTRLTVQRRMQPDIADLIRRPLYPELEDHPMVHTYPQVPGMYHRLYWLDHSHREDGSGEFDIKGTSHSNDYEVEMVKQLVSHLSKQGCYNDGDLAVITPYVGQLRKLRNELSNTFSVRMSEKDQDEIETIDEVVRLDPDSTHQIERKALTQTVRIATVSLRVLNLTHLGRQLSRRRGQSDHRFVGKIKREWQSRISEDSKSDKCSIEVRSLHLH
jgi:AAA domain